MRPLFCASMMGILLLSGCLHYGPGRPRALVQHQVTAGSLQIDVLLHSTSDDPVTVDFSELLSAGDYAHYQAPYLTEWEGYYKAPSVSASFAVSIRRLDKPYACGSVGAADFYADLIAYYLSQTSGDTRALYEERYESGSRTDSDDVTWAWKNDTPGRDHFRDFGRVITDDLLLQIHYNAVDVKMDEEIIDSILASVTVRERAPDSDSILIRRVCPNSAP